MTRLPTRPGAAPVPPACGQPALSVKQVQEVLGHASATETLDVYAHLWPADHDRTREAMRKATSLASVPETRDRRGTRASTDRRCAC